MSREDWYRSNTWNSEIAEAFSAKLHRGEGFVVDTTHHTRLVSRWISGKPEKSFKFGVRTKGKDSFPIQSFRCARCGFLEEYATGLPA